MAKKNEVKGMENAEVMNAPEVVNVDAEKKKEYKAVCRQLASCMKALEANFIKLAVGLAHINREKLYEIGGYKNIYDFAKENYAISKSTCYNFLGLVEVFGLTADSKPLFTSTQMIAMLPYIRKGGKVEEFSPDMSKREINRLVKEKLSNRLENNESDEIEQLELNEDCEVVTPSKECRNILITCRNQEDYNNKIDDIDMLILNMFNKSKKRVKIEIVAVEY